MSMGRHLVFLGELRQTFMDLAVGPLSKAKAAQIADAVVDDRGEFQGVIGSYNMRSEIIAHAGGVVAGIERAKGKLLADAGAAFAAGKDELARSLRAQAEGLDLIINSAKAEEAERRKEYGDG